MVRPLYDSVLSRFGIGSSSRVLDAGCGAGGFLVLARGRGATVSGLDAAAELIAIARRRVFDADIRQGESSSSEVEAPSHESCSHRNLRLHENPSTRSRGCPGVDARNYRSVSRWPMWSSRLLRSRGRTPAGKNRHIKGDGAL